MKYILPTIALLSVACLAWLEIALMYDHSHVENDVKIAYAFCIAAVGGIRYVLFLASSTLWTRKQGFGITAGMMSLGATIGLFLYAENLAGLEPNVRLIYHLLNALIACSEIAAAMILSPVNNLGDLEKERHRLAVENNQLRKRLKNSEVNQSELERLRRELKNLQPSAEKWATIAGKVGVVQRKSSRYMTVTPEGVIISVDADGNPLGVEPSIPTKTKAILNGHRLG